MLVSRPLSKYPIGLAWLDWNPFNGIPFCGLIYYYFFSWCLCNLSVSHLKKKGFTVMLLQSNSSKRIEVFGWMQLDVEGSFLLRTIVLKKKTTTFPQELKRWWILQWYIYIYISVEVIVVCHIYLSFSHILASGFFFYMRRNMDSIWQVIVYISWFNDINKKHTLPTKQCFVWFRVSLWIQEEAMLLLSSSV